MVRLSYFERIDETLPPELKPLLPVAPAITAESSLDDFGRSLLLPLLKSKENPEKIKSVLNDCAPLSLDDQRDLLLPCLLVLGSKSFSHMLNVIERNLPLLLQFNVSAGDRLQIVKLVYKCSKNHHQVCHEKGCFRLVADFGISSISPS